MYGLYIETQHQWIQSSLKNQETLLSIACGSVGVGFFNARSLHLYGTDWQSVYMITQ